MFFVHPQIKFEKGNFKKIFQSFYLNINPAVVADKLSFYFPDKNILFTDMARSAFKVILEKLNLKRAQILLPAFICDVFYPILKEYEIEPIFLDTDLKSFNIKIEEIPQKITPKTKAILISHTFGLPVDIDKIKSLIYNAQYKIHIIEDCAHSFFAKYKDIFVGNFGTVSFFSLYKQFPTVRGGLLIFPKEWNVNVSETKFTLRDFISLLNYFSPFAFFFKAFGNQVAPKMIRQEKSKKPARINRVSLNLFYQFLEETRGELKKRIELAKILQEKLRLLNFDVQEGQGNVFCYLSVLFPKEIEEKRDSFVKEMRKEKVFCTRIWKEPIILNKDVQKDYCLNLEDFPNTIEIAKRIINFPLQNYFQDKDVERIILATEKVLKRIREKKNL